MWQVVVFPDDEVAALPCSWIIEIEGETMCFWPEKKARTKRSRLDDLPSSGTDNWKLHKCRILMNGEKFSTFKKALAREILAQNISYMEDFDSDSDGATSGKKQKLSDNEEEFEFIRTNKEIHILDDVNIYSTSGPFAAGKTLNELNSLQSNSLVSENVEATNEIPENHALQLSTAEANNPANQNDLNMLEMGSSDIEDENINVIILPHDDNIPRNETNTLHEVEVFESGSDSEKLKTILLNQEAEKKAYTDITNRIDRLEKHIRKYGKEPFSKVIERLPLQVSSVEMFSKLEEVLIDATKTAMVDHFNSTIFEEDIKKYVKLLLNRFFNNEFYAHNVTFKTGGKVILNKSRTLSCIYECVEKKFNKERRDVEDTVLTAINQLKDSLRKQFPKEKTQKKNRGKTENKTEDKTEDITEDKAEDKAAVLLSL